MTARPNHRLNSVIMKEQQFGGMGFVMSTQKYILEQWDERIKRNGRK
jgi:hypothetical protein